MFLFLSRKLWRFRSCTARFWSLMCLLSQFIDVCGRPCVHAATRCLFSSRGASDSVHRQSSAFLLCNRDGVCFRSCERPCDHAATFFFTGAVLGQVVTCPCCVDRAWSRRAEKLRWSRSCSTSSWSMSLLCRFIPGRLRTRSLTCPLLSTTGCCTVEVPQHTVHRLFSWTFQLCNTDGYDSSSNFAYGGDDGFFDAFCVIFRAPPAMPELSASFSSFRALTPVSARGLQGCRSRREFTPR